MRRADPASPPAECGPRVSLPPSPARPFQRRVREQNRLLRHTSALAFLQPSSRWLPGQQARQAGDPLTGSRWSPAEVSEARQRNHIDHIAPFLFFAGSVRRGAFSPWRCLLPPSRDAWPAYTPQCVLLPHLPQRRGAGKKRKEYTFWRQLSSLPPPPRRKKHCANG